MKKQYTSIKVALFISLLVSTTLSACNNTKQALGSGLVLNQDNSLTYIHQSNSVLCAKTTTISTGQDPKEVCLKGKAETYSKTMDLARSMDFIKNMPFTGTYVENNLKPKKNAKSKNNVKPNIRLKFRQVKGINPNSIPSYLLSA